MTFSESITSCMGKYATFSGRASRSEFWWFYLFTQIVNWGISVATAVTYGPNDPLINIIPGLISIVFILPSLAVGCRRLHDIGKSGWWMLLSLTIIGIILLIVWWATDTKESGNKFGANPKEPQTE